MSEYQHIPKWQCSCNYQTLVVDHSAYSALEENLRVAIDFISSAIADDCICDAKWSGRDEHQFMAVGCPSCYCKETLAKIEGEK
jgi:hypothetical protein